MAKRMPPVEILPPDAHDPPATSRSFVADLPPDLIFTPVPRRKSRSNGLTPERQRIFIAMLAQCGSVHTACKAVGCSTHAVYHLRNSANAESFATAWDRAVERGARRVLDVLVDHAINGTPEFIYKDGQIVAERRHFNTRAQMWIVAHYLPERFGVAGGLMHSASGPVGLKRLKGAWRKEWDAEHYAKSREWDARTIARNHDNVSAIRRSFKSMLADDPAKRAAWELLTGPTDWSNFDTLPAYPGYENTPVNHNRPDVILTMAAPLGKNGEAVGDVMFGGGAGRD